MDGIVTNVFHLPYGWMGEGIIILRACVDAFSSVMRMNSLGFSIVVEVGDLAFYCTVLLWSKLCVVLVFRESQSRSGLGNQERTLGLTEGICLQLITYTVP